MMSFSIKAFCIAFSRCDDRAAAWRPGLVRFQELCQSDWRPHGLIGFEDTWVSWMRHACRPAGRLPRSSSPSSISAVRRAGASVKCTAWIPSDAATSTLCRAGHR